MAIYMQVEGVKGPIVEAGHDGFIELKSMEFGAGRGLGSPKSSGKDREGTEAQIGEITVTKLNDSASTKLMRMGLWGGGKKVEIHFTRTGSQNVQESYIKYVLKDVLISSYGVQSEGDRPIERLNLNFTEIEYSNVECDSDLGPGNPDRVLYDLKTGKGS